MTLGPLNTATAVKDGAGVPQKPDDEPRYLNICPTVEGFVHCSRNTVAAPSICLRQQTQRCTALNSSKRKYHCYATNAMLKVRVVCFICRYCPCPPLRHLSRAAQLGLYDGHLVPIRIWLDIPSTFFAPFF